MPSHKFVPVRRGHVNMRGMRVGGAVPILLNSVKKQPEKGGELSSNKIVGIVSPPPPSAVLKGGQLLKHINFGHAHKKDSERIKFIF